MAQKGRFSQPMGWRKHYADVKSIKNKSLHAEYTAFMALKWKRSLYMFVKLGRLQSKLITVGVVEIFENGLNI